MVTTAQQLRDSLDAIAAIEPGFAAALGRHSRRRHGGFG